MCVAHVKVELAIPCRLGVCKGYMLLCTMLLLQGNSLVQQFPLLSFPLSLSFTLLQCNSIRIAAFLLLLLLQQLSLNFEQARRVAYLVKFRGERDCRGRVGVGGLKSLSGEGECVREQTHSKLELDNGKQSKQMPLKYKHTHTHTRPNTSTHSHTLTYAHTHTQNHAHTLAFTHSRTLEPINQRSEAILLLPAPDLVGPYLLPFPPLCSCPLQLPLACSCHCARLSPFDASLRPPSLALISLCRLRCCFAAAAALQAAMRRSQ